MTPQLPMGLRFSSDAHPSKKAGRCPGVRSVTTGGRIPSGGAAANIRRVVLSTVEPRTQSGRSVVVVAVDVPVAVAGVITIGHGHDHDHDLLRLSWDGGRKVDP